MFPPRDAGLLLGGLKHTGLDWIREANPQHRKPNDTSPDAQAPNGLAEMAEHLCSPQLRVTVRFPMPSSHLISTIVGKSCIILEHPPTGRAYRSHCFYFPGLRCTHLLTSSARSLWEPRVPITVAHVMNKSTFPRG